MLHYFIGNTIFFTKSNWNPNNMASAHLEVILPPETPSSLRALLSHETAPPKPEHHSYPIHTELYLSRLGDELITPRLLGTG